MKGITDYSEIECFNKIDWTEKTLLDFALFHSARMKNANQCDQYFYVKQSMGIFYTLRQQGKSENEYFKQ